MSRTYDFIIRLAAKEMPPSAKLLDFGCGNGQVVLKALDMGYDAHGTDLYERGWERDRPTTLGNRLHQMPSPDKIPFPNDYFDIIITNQVFEHINDKPPVVRELARVLKPSGKLIAIFPTSEIIIEPHLKVPFVHRLRNGGVTQKMILKIFYAFRSVSPPQANRDVLVNNALTNLRNDLSYISDITAQKIFTSHFTLLSFGESMFLRDRIAQLRLLKHFSTLANTKFINKILRQICLCLANGVYIFSKSSTESLDIIKDDCISLH